ncbi:hypothetical protein [Mycobacterium mantenii]|uniref:hypothetical protein n=1 Tax=Mycobacterium mantenii TaxID=560555 RepID=UPI001301B60E|nr:hypothetical protein [Mycobacterium mantenii]
MEGLLRRFLAEEAYLCANTRLSVAAFLLPAPRMESRVSIEHIEQMIAGACGSIHA